MQLVVDELDGEHQHDTTNETDDHGSDRLYDVATCCDAHKTSQDAVEGE